MSPMNFRRIYSILDEKGLRCKIAEELFQRKYRELLKDLFKDVEVCSVYALREFVSNNEQRQKLEGLLHKYGGNNKTIFSMLNEVDAKLEEIRIMIGIKKATPTSLLELMKTKDLRLRDLCLLCLRDRDLLLDLGKELHWVHVSNSRHFWLCQDCLSVCESHGHISSRTIIILNTVIREWSCLEELNTAILSLMDLLYLLDDFQVVKVLSRLDSAKRDFLYEIYGQRGPGQLPFDFIGADEDGNAYLIDVMSVMGWWKHGPLSAREKGVVKRAKELGFKIMIPEVRFLENWRVCIELHDE